MQVLKIDTRPGCEIRMPKEPRQKIRQSFFSRTAAKSYKSGLLRLRGRSPRSVNKYLQIVKIFQEAIDAKKVM